jgi:DNA-binding CsgD family transcriptional regulator
MYYPVLADGVRAVIEDCPRLRWRGQVTLDTLVTLAHPPNDMPADLIIFMVPELHLIENEAAMLASAASAASTYRARYPAVAVAFLTDRPLDFRENQVEPYGVVALTAKLQETTDWLRRILGGAQTRVEFDRHLDMDRFAERYPITTREQEVIKELASGSPSNKELAARLGVTEHTVKIHLNSAFRKIGVQSRAQLVGHLLQHYCTSTLVTTTV